MVEKKENEIGRERESEKESIKINAMLKVDDYVMVCVCGEGEEGGGLFDHLFTTLV